MLSTCIVIFASNFSLTRIAIILALVLYFYKWTIFFSDWFNDLYLTLLGSELFDCLDCHIVHVCFAVEPLDALES